MKQCKKCGYIHDGTTCPNCGKKDERDEQRQFFSTVYGPLPPRINDTPMSSSMYKRTRIRGEESMRSTIYGAPVVNPKTMKKDPSTANSVSVLYGPPSVKHEPMHTLNGSPIFGSFSGSFRVGWFLIIMSLIFVLILWVIL